MGLPTTIIDKNTLSKSKYFNDIEVAFFQLCDFYMEATHNDNYFTVMELAYERMFQEHQIDRDDIEYAISYAWTNLNY